MARRILVVLALLGFAAGVAPVVHAYPPSVPTVTTDSSVYTPGSTVTITATGFASCVGAALTITITHPNGTTTVVNGTVGATGSATATFSGTSGVGTYTVVATAPGCESATTTFSVRTIPATGANSANWLYGAGLGVASGAALLLVARRRRHTFAH